VGLFYYGVFIFMYFLCFHLVAVCKSFTGYHFQGAIRGILFRKQGMGGSV